MTVRQVFEYRTIAVMGGCDPGILFLTKKELRELVSETRERYQWIMGDKILGWDVVVRGR